MYKVKYTFWNEKEFPGFSNSLSRIYDDSIDNYKEKYRKLDKKDLDMIYTFVKDLEYFYASIICEGIVTNKNFKNILEQLKSISLVVIPKKRDLYGATLGTEVSINPDIDAEYGLSRDEFINHCVSHELGHDINNKWYNEAKDLSKEIYGRYRNKKIFKIDSYKYLLFGFDLLNEVVAEETAKRVTNRLTKKKVNDINHNRYLSEHIFYDDLYQFALGFAKSFNYIKDTRNMSDEDVMLKLVRRSFDEDFIKNIKEELELSDPKKYENIITMLVCMGKIKASTYEIIGLRNNEKIDVDEYKEIFNSVKRRKQ